MSTIYLDVDGVINAVSKNSPALKITGWQKWATKKISGWQILYSPELIDELNRLAELPSVTFKWLTTWEDEAANELSPATGLNGQEWEVLHGDQHAWHGRDWWKLQAIREDVASNNDRFIWVDDDISAEPEALNWVKSEGGGLVISPNTTHGLTRSHIEKISRFIEAEGEQAA
jgi:hypothetical protein